jgi:DNA-directed RNA polymerase specialized sigma24 family protein
MSESVPSAKPKWRLGQEAFDGLLASLDSDRGRAGERYELLRQKLVKFFEWQGAYDAEELADETLNRVARRIEEGESIQNVAAYASGVARMVWREAAKRPFQSEEIDDRTPAPAPEPDDADEVARFECLDRCLAALPADQRELVLDYFADEKGAKIDNRRQMAARLGIEMNALRIRVHRIRARLELCVKECVYRRGAR